MSRNSKPGARCNQCQELELSLSLWMAANDAKSERIAELEAECEQLRSRVARLARLVGRDKAAPLQRRATNAR